MAVLNQAKLTSKVTTSSGQQQTYSASSNVQRTNNVDTDVVITKTASKNLLLPKDVVTITTVITNNTDINLESIRVSDTISEGAKFVEGSFELGGMTFPNYNIVNGITLPITIGGSGNEARFSFNIVVDDYVDVDKITDVSEFSVTMGTQKLTITSQPLELDVLTNEIYLLKESDRLAVKSGDVLTYTITISNNGIYENTDLVLTDELPETVTFVENSVKIDGVTFEGYNPSEGFKLNNLAVGDSIVVEFKVEIN